MEKVAGRETSGIGLMSDGALKMRSGFVFSHLAARVCLAQADRTFHVRLPSTRRLRGLQWNFQITF